MKNRIGLSLVVLLAMCAIPQSALAFRNPIQTYDMYADTHRTDAQADPEREQVVNSILPSNGHSSTAGSTGSTATSSTTPSAAEALLNSTSTDYQAQLSPDRRNAVLRESSTHKYSNYEEKPAWLVGPSFYSKPSLESIKAKYKKSDFAGCMQEASSYVRLHPHDTLGFYYLAMSYTKCNDKENAIKAYEKVIALNSNPMIVKYATNGRNCVLGNESEKCYENVNVPELIRPYTNIDDSILVPVDTNTLINQNMQKVTSQLNASVQQAGGGDNSQNGDNKGGDKKSLNLPFGDQDDKLDSFINAPYGNGFSKDEYAKYQEKQLKSLQEIMNKGDNEPGSNMKQYKNIKDFDNQKSDLGGLKLAYDTNVENEWQEFQKSPEYAQQQRELEQIDMMFGNSDNSKTNKNSDISSMMNYVNNSDNKNLSPDVLQNMMMQSVMSDLSL